jgi:hypothetical protein
MTKRIVEEKTANVVETELVEAIEMMEMMETKNELNNFVEENSDITNMGNVGNGLMVVELKRIPKFISLGKSQKYMNRMLECLGWKYSDTSYIPNEGHSASDLFIAYQRGEDFISTPILKNEFGVYNGYERQDWAVNSVRYILSMAWLRASLEEREHMVHIMRMENVTHDTDYTKIPKSFAYINDIVDSGKFKEFMEFVGYEPTTIFSNTKYPLCWKLKHNAWKDREWLKFNHNHRPNVVVNIADYNTAEDAAAAVITNVWRRLQTYYKVETEILRPLGIINNN